MDWKRVSIMTTEEGLEFICYKLDEIGITQFEMVEDAASTQRLLDETAQYWDYVEAETVLAERQPCVRVYLTANAVGDEQLQKLQNRNWKKVRCRKKRVPVRNRWKARIYSRHQMKLSWKQVKQIHMIQ